MASVRPGVRDMRVREEGGAFRVIHLASRAGLAVRVEVDRAA